MATHLMSEAEAETLHNLIANRVKAAACDRLNPVTRTHLVLFNPTTRQFGAWLIPNADPDALLPDEPTDIKRLKAAGFMVLCEIPEFANQPILRIWRSLSAKAAARQSLEARFAGMTPAERVNAKRATLWASLPPRSEELENEGSATLSSPSTIHEVCKLLRK